MAQADRIRADWRHWLLGAWPEPPGPVDVAHAAPDVLRVDGIRARLVLPPAAERPVPVLLVPTSHDWWGAAALRRGWGACLLANCDGDDDTAALARRRGFAGASVIARRAWAFSRALDALAGVPAVDASRVVAAGHSRNGKAALIAAAFDARIAGVVASSAGVLGTVPARLCADRHFGEGIELLTRHYPDWFHPRLRFFAGAEDRLPTDAHELLAVIAPRPVLLSVAVNDQVESTWAVEETRDALDGVRALVGGRWPTLLWRPGGHELSLEAVERCLDWAEQAMAGRPLRPPSLLAVPPRLHPRRWVAFGRPGDAEAPDAAAPPAAVAPGAALPPPGAPLAGPALRAAIGEALGAAPPEVTAVAARYGTERAHVAAMLGRDVPRAGVRKLQAVTREGVAVDVHLPDRRRERPAPLALWLGPLCRATGYAAGYEQATPVYELLPRDGWAVACFDAIGTGARVLEEAELGRRHPGWSPLGRWVRDAVAAIDAAAALPEVADGPAWLVGYAAGALAALHVAALHPDRVAGADIVAPHDGVPVLAQPARYGVEDLLRAAGGRPVLLLTPARDPEADPAAVAAAARAAGVAH
ncbi:MAG: serine aminopeptidase domain-containing protein, partial [Solirubrobacteraceae bacterium]